MRRKRFAMLKSLQNVLRAMSMQINMLLSKNLVSLKMYCKRFILGKIVAMINIQMPYLCRRITSNTQGAPALNVHFATLCVLLN